MSTDRETLPGMAVTETEPAVGVDVLVLHSDKWQQARRCNSAPPMFDVMDDDFCWHEAARWTWLPGQSPVERVLALGLRRDVEAAGVYRHTVSNRPRCRATIIPQNGKPIAEDAPDPQTAAQRALYSMEDRP